MRKSAWIIPVIFCLALNGFSQDRIVLISTNFGDMKFRLYDDTPKHRKAFIELANDGYYDGTLFYRILPNYLIQGGSKSSKGAPPGKVIGYGDPDKTVDDEIIPAHFHKKGVICAPRQPDEVNPFKQSDISQFYIVKGEFYSPGKLDTMELAVNRPIRNAIVHRIYTDEIKEELTRLKEEKKVSEFREIANKVKEDIETEFNLNKNILKFTDEQREAYTTIGGCPDLDRKYTIFGECISGFDVIDKIASLKTDGNNRPFTDVVIKVSVLN